MCSGWSEENRSIPRDRFRQMLGERADAPKAPRVLMRDKPIGARRAPLRQHALQVLEPAGDEIVHDAKTDARAHRLELRDRGGAFKTGRRAGVEFAHIVERGRSST